MLSKLVLDLRFFFFFFSECALTCQRKKQAITSKNSPFVLCSITSPSLISLEPSPSPHVLHQQLHPLCLSPVTSLFMPLSVSDKSCSHNYLVRRDDDGDDGDDVRSVGGCK